MQFSFLSNIGFVILIVLYSQENILIDNNGGAVLADFGLTRVQHDLSDLRSITENAGTFVYQSPELHIGGDRKSTKSSDVWALGMVIYQVFTGKQPYHGRFALTEICHNPPRLPSRPDEDAIEIGFTHELWDYLEKYCWAQPPRGRPSAKSCCSRLQALRSRYRAQAL